MENQRWVSRAALDSTYRRKKKSCTTRGTHSMWRSIHYAQHAFTCTYRALLWGLRFTNKLWHKQVTASLNWATVQIELSTQFELKSGFKERSKITSLLLVTLHSEFPLHVKTCSRVSSHHLVQGQFCRNTTETAHYCVAVMEMLRYTSCSFSGWI